MANEGSETSISTRRTRIHPLIIILPFIALIVVILLVAVIALPDFGTSLTAMVPLDDLIKIATLILIIIIIVIIFIPTVGGRGTSIDQPLPVPGDASSTANAVKSSGSGGSTTKKRVVDAEIVEEKRTKATPNTTANTATADKQAEKEPKPTQQPAPPSEPTVVNWPRDVSDGVYGDTLIDVGKNLTLRLRTLLIDFRTLRKM